MLRLFLIAFLLLYYSCTTNEKGISDSTRAKIQKVYRTGRLLASGSSGCKDLSSHFGHSKKNFKKESSTWADLDDAAFKKEYENYMENEDSLINFQQRNSNQVGSINEYSQKYFKLPVKSSSTTRVESLNKGQVDRIYQAVRDHPVANQCRLRTYDPEGNIGFCFGRAMTAHLELLASGVQKDKIRKIWAVGSMENNSMNMRFHVCTVVKARNGSWWAVDSIFSRPLKVEEWMKKMKKMDSDGQLMFVTTSASRFSPRDFDKYNRKSLGNVGYRRYFQDLLKSYRENDGPFNGMVFRPTPD